MLRGPCRSQDQASWDRKTLKSDRGLNLEPRVRLSINKLIKNLVFLKGQLGKLIKNLMFLKVETRNFDMGSLV